MFQPLLYQVATGGLSPADVTSALRWTLRRQRNTRCWLGEVVDFDLADRRVRLTDGELEYDILVVAPGARHHYFGHDEWERHAPGLKTIEDATEIRSRVLHAFEKAERQPAAAERNGWLTFAVVGGGPTGVELAGAIAELARHSMVRDFRAIDTRRARIFLIEATDRPLPGYPPGLSQSARRSLERLGVTVRVGARVTGIEPDAITVQRDDGRERIPARTVLWAAGIQASPLGQRLADTSGAEVDRLGRVVVEPDLTLPGHPEVFVIGDLARFAHQTGEPLPGIAPVAMQQGRHVANTIRRRLTGRPVRAFRYFNKGELATIGRAAAVANFGQVRFSGFPAWLLWLFVHLMYLVEFENRVLVFFQWAWNYLTWNRGARLIAHGTPGDRGGT